MRDALVPWRQIYDLVFACGNLREVKDFSVAALEGIRALVPCDRAVIFFLDANGKPRDQHLYNTDPRWLSAYLSYYAQTDDGRYSLEQDKWETPGDVYLGLHVWDKEKSGEFIPEYIRPRNLLCSLGFFLTDLNGQKRTVFALDRTDGPVYTEEEQAVLRLIVAQLNNLHKHLFSLPAGRKNLRQIAWEATSLSDREIQVASLLCQGLSTANISRILRVAPATTNKHIANIYKKLQVNSRHEMMIKLLE